MQMVFAKNNYPVRLSAYSILQLCLVGPELRSKEDRNIIWPSSIRRFVCLDIIPQD
jgi:hypothetical protein